jgi:type II secretory pathway component PulL
MRGQYIYDDNYKLKKAKTSAWTRVRRVLIFFVASLSMAVLYYVIFALVFSTDEEKRLRTENKAYESELPELEEKERNIANKGKRMMEMFMRQSNKQFEETSQ